MIEKCKELKEIIESCQRRLIYVDNPSLNDTRKFNINKEKRSDSREMLLEHLNKTCQGIYKPQNLKEIGAKVNDDMREKEELERELDVLKKELENLKSKILESDNIW